MKIKHFILILFFIVSLVIAYSLYFIRSNYLSERKMQRLITFSKLLNSLSEKNCEKNILDFRREVINNHGFYDLYVFNVNGDFLGGGGFKDIKDFNHVLDMAIKWKGTGTTQINNKKTAHWGRCSKEVLYIVID